MTDYYSSGTVKEKIPKPALAALILGIVSVILIPVILLISFRFEAIGMITLFRNLVFPLSIAAIIVGTIARRLAGGDKNKGHTAASIGLILGLTTFGLSLLTVVVIALFFSFLLFAQ